MSHGADCFDALWHNAGTKCRQSAWSTPLCTEQFPIQADDANSGHRLAVNSSSSLDIVTGML